MDLVADTGKLLGSGEPRRTGADDGDALAGHALGGLGIHPALFPGLVGDGAFDGLDGDRHVFQVQRTRRLARRWADPAGEFGEIVGGMQVQRRIPPVAVIDEVVPVRDLVVHRAAAMAIGDAAIHAARRLPADIALLQRDDEFAEMPHAVRSGGIGAVLALDFQKARDLTHRVPRLCFGRTPAVSREPGLALGLAPRACGDGRYYFRLNEMASVPRASLSPGHRSRSDRRPERGSSPPAPCGIRPASL